jgi:hypothetical protein
MTNQGWGVPPAEANVEAAPVETPEEFAARRDNAILTWRHDKQQLDFWKGNEAARRAEVTAICFPEAKKGTQRYPLGSGYALKLVYGYNYKLGNKEMVDPINPGEAIPVRKQVEMLEDAIAELGNEGPFLAQRLIKWTPELVEREYLALDSDNETHMKAKALIDAILTITPASPQLALEEPKASK